MHSESSSTGYERLNTLVISLGMEISDSILSALRHETESCRREHTAQIAVIGPVLMGIDVVIRHIDETRALTDVYAFTLLGELVQAYRLIIEEHQEPQEAWGIASEALDKVFSWQHRCILEQLKKTPSGEVVGPAEEKSSAGDMEDLLIAVQQEIAATGIMAVRESAALLELVHVHKNTANSFTDESEQPEEVESGEFNSVVRESISSLQQTLHQEMGRLRHELVQK